MNIHLRCFRDIVVFEIEGCIDNNSVPELYQSLSSIIESGYHTVIMGLKKTKVLLSTGIGFFIEAHDLIEEAGGHLILVEVPHEISYILSLTEIASFFGEMPTLAEAFAQAGVYEHDFITGLPRKKRDTTVNYLHSEAKEQPKHKSEILRLRELRKKEEPKGSRHSMDYEKLKKFIYTYMPSRLAVDIVNYYISGKRSSMQISKLATALHQPPRTTARMMKKLENRGIMKHLGAEIYNYAPTKDLREQFEEFFIRWHRADEHRNLLMLVLAAENSAIN